MNILSKKLHLIHQGALFGAVFLLLLFATLLFTNPAKASGECAWVSDSLITCGESDFWFDTDLSISKGEPLYQMRNKDGWQGAYLFISPNGREYKIRKTPENSGDAIGGDLINTPKRNDRSYANNNDPNDPKHVGENDQMIEDDHYGDVFNGNKNLFFCGILTKAVTDCWSGIGGSKKSIDEATGAKLAEFAQSINDAIASEEGCANDAGKLGFVLCPILETTQGAVKILIGNGDPSSKGFLVELLTIRPLSQTSTPDLYNGWQAIRNMTLGFYILIFVLIIFGNGIGYDPYTIKRALPRLAAGVVLTFASWWIMQTLVDASNVAGNVIPAILADITNQASIANYSVNLSYNLAIGSVILMIILAFIALGALLIGIAGLIMRVVIIYALVLLAPLAFLAWVLPNTEGVFKKWWQNLVRVLMMFPIVTGMLALSIFFGNIMMNTQAGAAGNTGSTGGSISNSVTGIVGMLAPLIAIILIPKTFKWGGAMFAAAAGYMAAKATQGKDWGKNQGRDRVGSSMRDGVGAKGLRAIGTKKVNERNDDGSIKLDENGKKKFKRQPRMGVSRIPGIGGITATKAEVATARREARIKSRAEEGIKDINQDGLQRIYQSMGARQRSTPRGLAVKNELDKKRGEMLKDYAEAVRTGNDTSFFESRISDIDSVMGGTYSDNTRARMNNINVEDRRSKGASLSGDTRVDVPKAEAGSAPVNPIKRAWQNRASHRGQGGYINPSAFRGSSSGPTPGPTGGAGSPGGSPFGGGGSPRPSGGSGSGSSGGGPIPHTPTSPPPPPAGGAPTYSTPTGAPRYTTGGVPIPPPPSSSTPSWSAPPPSSSTPPPFRGTPPPPSSSAPPRPAPPPAPTPGGGGALPSTPSSSGASSGGGTVINNVTNEVSNNVTNNVSTSRDVNQASPVGSIGGPTTIPSGALGDLSRQIGRMMSRTGSSAGLASLESKISTLQDMIVREGRNSNNVKNLLRTMREEAGSLPSHEQGAAEDALNNFEHQSGINGPESSGGAGSGDI